jgi:carboxypeptidase family protein
VNLARKVRRFALLALLPLFALIFWAAALGASTIPELLVIGVNVHGMNLTSYAGAPVQPRAPLSLQMLEDAQQDATGPTPAAPGPSATAGRRPNPTPTPRSSPSSAPSPSPLPLPTPLPLPSPTPTPVPGSPTIGGQVVDGQTRLPIVAATVSLSPGGASTLTDANGNFSFTVNPGTYTVTASAAGYGNDSQTVTVSGGQKANLTFRLTSVTAYGTLTGSVMDRGTRAPVVGATVMLSNGMIRVTDLSGNFNYAIVLNGSYTLTVSALGYLTQSVPVTVKPGHTTNVPVVLVRG